MIMAIIMDYGHTTKVMLQTGKVQDGIEMRGGRLKIIEDYEFF